MKIASFAIITLVNILVVCGLIQMSKGESIGYKILGIGIIMGFCISGWSFIAKIRTNDGRTRRYFAPLPA